MSEAMFEVYLDSGRPRSWRWRLRAANGQVVAQSEAYASRAGAVRGAEDCKGVAADAKVWILDN